MKKIAVLTSGGDSPGMNAGIRAVVRSAHFNDVEIYGIHKGYAGLLAGELFPMQVSDVGNIIQRGGTILHSSRCPEFHEKDVRANAHEILKSKNIDGLIVMGGDGSFNGAYALGTEHNFPVMGIPCTIDNDISGTQYSIGFDTAVETAVEAVDKIRDTAASHERSFIVEVMGRSSTSIATHVGVCTGAEAIIFPDRGVDYKAIADHIKKGVKRGKNSSILIVAEGKNPGFSYEFQKKLKDNFQLDSHVCILGHIQRGGRPSSLDRFIASNMGYFAVNGLLRDAHLHVTAFNEGYTSLKPMQECLAKKNDYLDTYQELARTLSI